MFGRFEADRPNELWTGDALHGPVLGGRKTYLFAFLDDHSRAIVGHRFGFAEDTVRLAAALRPALGSRGVPDAVYVDNGSAFVDAWLLRACAKLGIRLVHSTPGRPQGRGKIERFFRTVRDQFLVEITGAPERDPNRHPVADLDELNRLFTAWVETVYHRREHSETGAPPLARWHAGGPFPLPAPAALAEAFLWEAHRTVTKTALVSLQGNTYQVDPLLVGHRVELVFDPFDLTTVAVRVRGIPAGTAIPHRIGRHSHVKARPETPPEQPALTGIDYARLIADTHHAELAAGVNYAALADTADAAGELPGQLNLLTDSGNTDSEHRQRKHRRPGGVVIDRLQGFFGFTRTPFGRDLAPGMLHRHTAHGEAVARIGWCVTEHRIGVITGEVGAGKTVAVRAALAALDPTRHTIIYLPNPTVGVRGIHHQIVAALGARPLTHHATLVPQTVDALAVEQVERGRTPVVVIDEAHLLDHAQLESIRMLTNHDMDSTSPFACLLVGQPTLRRRMKLGVLAALDQRIGLRYAMPPMAPEETGSYLRHHVTLAGRSDTLFSDDAAALIHQTSRGYPRAVNNVALQALVAAFAADKAIVDESSTRAAVAEVTAE